MQEKKNQKKESFRFGKQKAAVTEKTDRRAGHLQAKNEKVGSAKKPGMKKKVKADPPQEKGTKSGRAERKPVRNCLLLRSRRKNKFRDRYAVWRKNAVAVSCFI